MGEILFIGHRVPFPPDRGDKIRSHHVLHALARLAPVHVACFADDAADLAQEPELAAVARSHCLVRRTKPLPLAGMEALARGKPVSLAAFHDERIARYVRDVLVQRPVGAIYVFSGQMGQYVPASFTGRVVIDLVDVDSAKFEAYAGRASWPLSWLHAREGRLLRAEEQRLVHRADAALLVSEDEAALLRGRIAPPPQPYGAVRALGNGIAAVDFCRARVAPHPALGAMPGPRLIFTGQMDYPPNIAAAVRAVDRIMPRIRASMPDASFHVVGRKPAAAVRALDGRHGCRVWGEVPDVRPWLAAADLALVPLEIARGVQNKVLEAMAMELPVVATTAAATGIAHVPGTTIAIADADQALADAAVALLRDPVRAETMGAAARATVRAEHSWETVPAQLAPLLGFANDPVRDAA